MTFEDMAVEKRKERERLAMERCHSCSHYDEHDKQCRAPIPLWLDNEMHCLRVEKATFVTGWMPERSLGSCDSHTPIKI